MCFLSRLFCNTGCRNSAYNEMRTRQVDAGGREACERDNSCCGGCRCCCDNGRRESCGCGHFFD